MLKNFILGGLVGFLIIVFFAFIVYGINYREEFLMSKAYKDGQEAKVNGIKDNANPYIMKPALATQWLKGYIDKKNQLKEVPVYDY